MFFLQIPLLFMSVFQIILCLFSLYNVLTVCLLAICVLPSSLKQKWSVSITITWYFLSSPSCSAYVCLEGRVWSEKDLQENTFEEQGYLNHRSSKVSVFLAKTPTSFRRLYVLSVLQQCLRRTMLFAKLKPLVSYVKMPKLMLLQLSDWFWLFYGKKWKKYIYITLYNGYLWSLNLIGWAAFQERFHCMSLSVPVILSINGGDFPVGGDNKVIRSTD